MTPTDKYAERARQVLRIHTNDWCGRTPDRLCDYCEPIAHALEQVALEARIVEREKYKHLFDPRFQEDFNWGTNQLRARLAELEKPNVESR